MTILPQETQPLAAEEMVRLIMDDLNARAGYDLSNVDGEVLNEIKQKWASIILNNMPTPAQAKLPLMADKFTPSQKQMLSLGVAVIDELRPILMANKLSENDASEICYQLTIKLRDRLENNADFRGLTAQANHAAMPSEWQPIETADKTKTIIVTNDLGEVCPAIWNEHHWIVQNSYGNPWTYGHDATHWMPLPNPPAALGAPNDQR